jgi:glycolate oxidase FAD binding subunit
MAEILHTRDERDITETLAWALAGNHALELRGRGSKAGLGHTVAADHVLDLSRLTGISSYEPEELVLTAQACTPMAEIEALLVQRGQELAFEPPDFGALLGTFGGTLAGALSCNLAGPRRFKAGAARDHFLGFRGVSGRGEAFKAGGKVVKNVTGYDLCKLVAGSYGTLVALTEVTVKVLPAPETQRTLRLRGTDPQAAMIAAANSPHEVSGLACADGVTAIRIEGPEPSVAYRLQALTEQLGGDSDVLDDPASRRFWRDVRDVAVFSHHHDRALWRLSVPPAGGCALAAKLGAATGGRTLVDWGGGLIWLEMPDGDPKPQIVRGALAEGHAMLFRAGAPARAAAGVFQPEAPAIAALSQRVRRQFDPQGLFNPGRMGG